jgi:hypothetical protein
MEKGSGGREPISLTPDPFSFLGNDGVSQPVTKGTPLVELFG